MATHKIDPTKGVVDGSLINGGDHFAFSPNVQQATLDTETPAVAAVLEDFQKAKTETLPPQQDKLDISGEDVVVRSGPYSNITRGRKRKLVEVNEPEKVNEPTETNEPEQPSPE